METQIQKWGNSLGVRIPAKLASDLHLKVGRSVNIKVEGDHLSIYPKKYSLEQLLQQVSENNMHNEEFNEDTRGKESW